MKASFDVLIIGAGSAGCVLAARLNGGAGPIAPYVWGASFFCLLLYVVRGWALSGVGPYGLLDLLWAPVYVLWKLTLRFRDRRHSPEEWVRTTREVRM